MIWPEGSNVTFIKCHRWRKFKLVIIYRKVVTTYGYGLYFSTPQRHPPDNNYQPFSSKPSIYIYLFPSLILMGLICIALEIPKLININGFLLGLLDSLKFVVMVAFARLGLLNSPEQVSDTEEDHSTDSTSYVLVMDGLSPSLIPLQSLMALIKKRLSVMEYSNLLQKYGAHDDEDHVDMVCSVCLNCVERSHEVREQPNCCHVFHWECLDRWVDEGQVTCPLCRSLLFPARGESTRSGRNIDHFVG